MSNPDELPPATERGAQIQAKARELLESTYPEFFSTEMDHAFFVKTLERPTDGQVLEYKGKRWAVKYSWLWTHYVGIPIYCAELEPVDKEIGSRLDAISRLTAETGGYDGDQF